MYLSELLRCLSRIETRTPEERTPISNKTRARIVWSVVDLLLEDLQETPKTCVSCHHQHRLGVLLLTLVGLDGLDRGVFENLRTCTDLEGFVRSRRNK